VFNNKYPFILFFVSSSVFAVSASQEQIQTMSTRFAYLGLNQTEVKQHLPLLESLEQLNKCKESSLINQFDAEGNSDLDKARVILFSEDHDNVDTVMDNYCLISQLAHAGDIVLLEDYYSERDLAEEALLRALTFQQKLNSPEISLQIQLYRQIKSRLNSDDIPFENIRTFGWDLHRKQLQNHFVSSNIATKLRIAFSTISLRNSAFEPILKELQCKRVFIVAGIMHLPTKRAFRMAELDPVFDVKVALVEMQRILNSHNFIIFSHKNLHSGLSFLAIPVGGIVVLTAASYYFKVWTRPKIIYSLAAALFAGLYAFINTAIPTVSHSLNLKHLQDICPKD